MEGIGLILGVFFITVLIKGGDAVIILKNRERSTFSSCGDDAYVELLCQFQYSNITVSSYQTIEWNDITDTSNAVVVAKIDNSNVLTAFGPWVNASVTRLNTDRKDASIGLRIPKNTRLKVFDCAVTVIDDSSGASSRPVFAYNNSYFTGSCSNNSSLDDNSCSKNETSCVESLPSTVFGACIITVSVICAVIAIASTATIWIGGKTLKVVKLVYAGIGCAVLGCVLCIASIAQAALYLDEEASCTDTPSGTVIGMTVCGVLGLVFTFVAVVLILIGTEFIQTAARRQEDLRPNRSKSVVSSNDVKFNESKVNSVAPMKTEAPRNGQVKKRPLPPISRDSDSLQVVTQVKEKSAEKKKVKKKRTRDLQVLA